MVIIAAAALGAAASAGEPRREVPALVAGDILLSREFPYRSVRGTDLTLYQLARLGYSSARPFQEKAALQADNIIGPATTAAVQNDYARVFHDLQARAEPDALALSAAFVRNGETAFLQVSVSNVSARAIRFRGLMATDEHDQIVFSEPMLIASGKVCTWKGSIVACRGWSLIVSLCPNDTILEPGASIERKVACQRLEANEHGGATLTMRYLDASGAIHEVTTELGNIPKLEK